MKNVAAIPLLLMLLFVYGAPHKVLAATEQTVRLYRNGTSVLFFAPFTDASVGSVAIADLGNDGTAEIIVGAGYGSKPKVGVFRQDGSLIGSFLAYGEGFTGGVNVAACDLDGDGLNEIVTGAGFGGGPHVRIFTHEGKETGKQFFAYDTAFRGGTSVACGDVTGDGEADIVTGSGPGGGPHVNVFSGEGVLLDDVFTGDATLAIGTNVSVGNIDSDSTLEILAVPAASAIPTVTTIDWKNGGLAAVASASGLTTATQPVAAATYKKEIVTSDAGFGSTARVITNAKAVIQTPFTSLTDATMALATGSDAKGDLLVAAKTATPLAPDASAKYIRVDLSEQRLRAYENGIPSFTFLVSTGVRGYDTPLGKTAVMAKLPVHDYSWYYGAGDPRNYDLPGVKWNLRFRNHYYIHSAYWHNNFGHVMSHGCVNTSIPDAEKVFNWADVGTLVEIVP